MIIEMLTEDPVKRFDSLISKKGLTESEIAEIREFFGLHPYKRKEMLKTAYLLAFTNRRIGEIAKASEITREQIYNWLKKDKFLGLIQFIRLVGIIDLRGLLVPPTKANPKTHENAKKYQNALKKEILQFSPVAIIVFVRQVLSSKNLLEQFYAIELLLRISLTYKFGKRKFKNEDVKGFTEEAFWKDIDTSQQVLFDHFKNKLISPAQRIRECFTTTSEDSSKKNGQNKKQKTQKKR